jgi:triosephosphate isomerase
VNRFSEIIDMSRKFWVGGNWKMNGDKKAIDEIVKFLSAGPLDPDVGKAHQIKLKYPFQLE